MNKERVTDELVQSLMKPSDDPGALGVFVQVHPRCAPAHIPTKTVRARVQRQAAQQLTATAMPALLNSCAGALKIRLCCCSTA